MKRISILFALTAPLASGANAFAAGITLTTNCPTSFQCAFSGAQTKSLADASNPGQPGVFIGYLSFDGGGAPTLSAVESKDGTIKAPSTALGTCTAGTSGAPATLDFTANNGPILKFVTFHGGAELKFISTDTKSGLAAPTVGSCRQI